MQSPSSFQRPPAVSEKTIIVGVKANDFLIDILELFSLTFPLSPSLFIAPFFPLLVPISVSLFSHGFNEITVTFSWKFNSLADTGNGFMLVERWRQKPPHSRIFGPTLVYVDYEFRRLSGSSPIASLSKTIHKHRYFRFTPQRLRFHDITFDCTFNDQ